MRKIWSYAVLTAALLGVAGCETKSIQPTKENSPLLADPDGKKMNIMSVTLFDRNDVPFMINEAKRFIRATDVNRKAFKFGIYPSVTAAEVAKDAKAFGELKKGLEGSGVEAGILIVCSVGQGWTVGSLPYEPMEYAVNQKGELNYRICMLDPKFRKHIHDSIVLFAKEKPAFILMDDDVRLLNNSDYGAECFCKSHMKIYNAKMPRKFANDRELVSYLEKAPADDPCVRIFEAERRATLLSYAKLIRDAIDEVDSSIPCGICAGGAEYLFSGEVARALAGKNPSFMRIHNANYLELETQQFNIVMYVGAYRTKMAEGVDYLLDESDTYGRHRYNKSAISMHSHITGAILYGASGAELWLDNLLNKEVKDSNMGYEEIVKANRRFYDALLLEMPHVTWQGPVTPIVDVRKRFNPARAREGVGGYMLDMQIAQLNRFGIPAQYEFISGQGVYMLNGAIAQALTDDELKQILSGKAVIDGQAALEITRRGMTDYLGCTPKIETFYPGVEKLCFGGTYRLPLHSDGTMPNLTEVSSKAEVLGHFTQAPGTEGKGAKPGPATILYKNPYGGTVVTRAQIVGKSRIADEMPEVKMLLLEIFRRLDPELIKFYNGEEQPVHFRCGKHDRGGYLLALINLSFDAMTEIDLRTDEKVSSVEFLDGDGVYKPLKFTTNDKGVVVEKALPCYAPLILRVR
ncbi:MAG: hypothetical protein MJ033_01050 [Victivallaceae bacterium]|nr:hypothetical protein [Victivallaceae bacterium]